MILKKLMAVLLLFCGTKSFTRNYYVSSGGDNTTGLAPETAFKTIDKLNSSWTPIVAGDSILFHAGETFYGQIIIQKNGLSGNQIVICKYGVGADPIITGLTTITGWTNLGGNIWEASTPLALKTPNLVLRNSIPQQVGRYPNANAANAGYLTYTSSTVNSVTGSALSTTTNWTNAEVVVRWARWATKRRKVLSHSAGTVSFTTMSSLPKPNYGYFFQRDPRTLDQDGEWYQDSINNKLRMYFGNNNPNVYTIEMSRIDTLCNNRRSYITFSSLNFVGAGRCAIMNTSGTSVIIKDCQSNNSGGEAFVSWFATNISILRCSTYNSLGGGLRLFGAGSGAVNLTASYNTIRNSATIVGMEMTDVSSSARGINARGGDNITVSYNTIKNSGYNGIEWQGNNVLIYRNLIDTFCNKWDDGGGIYTYEAAGSISTIRTNRIIRGNIVINGIGARFGAPSLGSSPEDLAGATSVSGIYNDEGSRTIRIDSNTVANIPYHGIQGNGNQDLTILDNVMYNCYVTVSQQRLSGEDPQTGFIIKRNIFYPDRRRFRDQTQNLPTAVTQTQNYQRLGTAIDSNYYTTKTGADTSLIIQTANSDGSLFSKNYRNFSYIKTTMLREVSSIFVVNTGSLEYNATSLIKTVMFPGLSKKDVYGNVYNNSVAIPAWYSKVLIPNGVITPDNLPPVVDAGADSTITLPQDSVHIIGTAGDFDGTVASTVWSKKSGPVSFDIDDPTSLETVVNNLVEGTYEFQIIATDNDGAKDTSIVVVMVLPAIPPVNEAPTVNAGMDQQYDYTTTSTTLTATASDIDGTISTVLWEMVVGSGSSIVSNSTLTTLITGLTPGIRIYRVTVTDNDGATSEDFVRVTIDPEPSNVPPLIVFPEPVVHVYLPEDTTTLTIIATDTDGSIVSYAWTGDNGTIVSPDQFSTLVTGLTVGTHTFTVVITDNDGATTEAEFTVIVHAAVPAGPRYLLNFKVYPNQIILQ